MRGKRFDCSAPFALTLAMLLCCGHWALLLAAGLAAALHEGGHLLAIALYGGRAERFVLGLGGLDIQYDCPRADYRKRGASLWPAPAPTWPPAVWPPCWPAWFQPDLGRMGSISFAAATPCWLCLIWFRPCRWTAASICAVCCCGEPNFGEPSACPSGARWRRGWRCWRRG